jgi:molecular chaperone GrpE
MSGAKRRIPINPRADSPSAAAAAEGHAAAEGQPDDLETEPTAERDDVSTGLPDGLELEEDGLELEDPEFEELEFDPLAAIAAERDAYLDGLLRLKAEFENFRKRADRDVLEARSRARMGLLAEFLPVLDNLERALNAAEHHEEGKVLEGVRLTHSMFADLLRKEGVTEVDPLGEPFDPHMHEALMAQPSDSEEGTVTAVFERGYVFGDRVLRPAKVVVSAGPAGE